LVLHATVWRWFGVAFYVAFFVWCLAQVLVLRGRVNRVATAAHLLVGEQVRVTRWARGWHAVGFWRTRPRSRLTSRDWDPRFGFVAQPTFIGAALIAAAVHALTGAHQSDRLASIPLFAAGAVLVTLVVLFLLRPVAVPGGRFELRSAGYDPDEVDAFMATIDLRTRVEIETVTFHLARPGYEFKAVDDKIDRLLGDATPTDARRRAEGKHTFHAMRPSGSP
jgi:hypothetical protein